MSGKPIKQASESLSPGPGAYIVKSEIGNGPAVTFSGRNYIKETYVDAPGNIANT